MSLFTQKILLMFVLSLLSAHNVVASYFKTAVTITNTLSGNLDLNIHCKSGDDDLGPHLLHQGQSFSWSFGNNFFGGTLYFCSFQWNNEIHSFDVYDEDNDLLKCYKSNCIWLIKQSGPCKVHPDEKHDECVSWPK
jgi:hypothetical protein